MEANKKFLSWFRWMSLIVLAGSSILLFLAAKPQSDWFSKYKAVEAYEIRPGILMMPRYAEDGQVCEIGLERRHYTPEMIHLDSSMQRTMIDQIVDELAPVSERGPKTNLFGGREIAMMAGGGMTTVVDYENVSVQLFSSIIFGKKGISSIDGNVAATITWKNRKCQ
jgi:hypothetical protein